MHIWKIAAVVLLIPTAAMARPSDESPFDLAQRLSFMEGAPLIHPSCGDDGCSRIDLYRARVTEGGIHAAVTNAARAHGIPAALAHGIVRIESNYRCGARNRSGATGIMQVMAKTARGVGVTGNLTTCQTGLEAGMRYLRQAYERSGGNWCSAASLFNSGIAGSGRCTAYGRRVLRLARI